MAPYTYGEDAVYPPGSFGGTASPLGWEKVDDIKRGAERNPVGLFLREYVLSNIFFMVLLVGIMAHAVQRATWGNRRYWGWKFNMGMKRGFDLAASLLGLVLSAPVFLVLPILIKLDSPGPVFFRQLRVGVNRRQGSRRHATLINGIERRNRDRRKQNLHGRPFEIIKFRSMVQNAENKCGPVWATGNDPRITRLGLFLRKTRLDELPQLFNVLRGEMSLVGPRPERPFFVDKLSQEVPGFLDRLEMTPGITGLAQVKNGYDTSVQSVRRKIEYDLTYIKGWTIVKDLKILLNTIIVVINGRGAC